MNDPCDARAARSAHRHAHLLCKARNGRVLDTEHTEHTENDLHHFCFRAFRVFRGLEEFPFFRLQSPSPLSILTR